MFNVHITPMSQNAKTGPIPVTTTSMNSCPETCQFNTNNAGGCYANGGPLRIHWKKVSDGERGGSWDEFLTKVSKFPNGQLWRHNQAGDLPHDMGIIRVFDVVDLVKANSGRKGFTYTHHDITKLGNRSTVEYANDNGFTINVSGNNPDHAVEMKGITHSPVVSVVADDFWNGRNHREYKGETFVRCPAEVDKEISCATCGVCSIASRKSIIGFTAHGIQKKKAAIIARG